MEKSICKINVDKENKVGTGFFCGLPFPDRFNLLPVLITCNHVLGKNSIAQGSKINFTLKNDEISKSIVINNSRRTYTSIEEEKDITIVEINPQEDDINKDSFLDVDEDIDKDDVREIYQNKSVYMIHYEDGNITKESPGIISIIQQDQIKFKHNCDSMDGSSGGPIINSENNGVIGIHKGFFININLGILLKLPIEEFYESHKNSKRINIIRPTTTKISDKGNFYVSNIELLKIYSKIVFCN
jgi:hypothetical protein